MSTTINEPMLRNVPLNVLFESADNPRRTFPEAKLNELAASNRGRPRQAIRHQVRQAAGGRRAQDHTTSQEEDQTSRRGREEKGEEPRGAARKSKAAKGGK